VSISWPSFGVEDRVADIGMGVYEAGRRVGTKVSERPLTIALFRISSRGDTRLATGTVADGPLHLLEGTATISDLLATDGALGQAAARQNGESVPHDAVVLAPTDGQEVWASGVTYSRSRQARQQESSHADVYQLVYEAQRPELFLKAPPGLAIGTGGAVGARDDSTWDVPEPELAVVFDAAARVVAYTIGNDMSSRSIEGENPLYLPQAKIYDRSLGLGPCLVPASAAPAVDAMKISMTVRRGDADIFSGAVELTAMRRSIDELGEWLFRARSFPHGVILLTGTGIVPDDDFTSQPGDEIAISISGLGTLHNTVQRVGVGPLVQT
jgi:2-dehydro-3-deoxy-D-arabinonate dehydratase